MWTSYLTQLRQVSLGTWVLVFLCSLGTGFVIGGYLLLLGVWSWEEVAADRPQVLGLSQVLGTIYVDVSGAVEQPGVYQFQTGERVAQALERAGGLSVEADTAYIARQLNLADGLKDGQKVYVPFMGEGGEREENQGQGAVVQSGKVSINTAASSELESLPQVGEKRAADIIQNRPYLSLDELLSKEVVTEKIFTQIEGLIEL